MRDNYQTQLKNAMRIFLEYDQEQILSNFQLEHDERFIFVTFIKKPYRIQRNDGFVERMDKPDFWQPAGFEEVLSIYDMICSKNGKPVLTGSWSPIGSLGGMKNTSRAVGESNLEKYAHFFTGKGDALAKICETLGGIPAPLGDVAYYIPVFDFFSVYLRFYDADEEFPAQLQLLWDKNTCHYIHYETTFYIAIYLFQRILELLRLNS